MRCWFDKVHSDPPNMITRLGRSLLLDESKLEKSMKNLISSTISTESEFGSDLLRDLIGKACQYVLGTMLVLLAISP